jgi:predicted nucleic acid-binding protein
MIRSWVVLDTNECHCRWGIEQAGRFVSTPEGNTGAEFTLLVSVPLFVEYEATLKRKKIRKLHGLSHQDVDVLLEVWAKVCEPVSLSFLWPQLRNPGDETVLETAVNGSVQAIVTFNIADFRHACSRFGVELVQDRPQSWIVSNYLQLHLVRYSCKIPNVKKG